jgi:hypothetical protein
MSLIALGSCQLFSYSNARLTNTEPVDTLIDDVVFPDGQLSSVTTATFGLLTWNPENNGCRRYGDPNSLSQAFGAARVGGVTAALFASASFLIICAEFACCRFCFSRCMAVTFVLVAAVAQAVTMSVYSSDICLSKSAPYACSYERGTSFAIAAMVLLAVTSISACAAPKARPLIRVLMEHDRSDNDPCCYCWRKDKLNIKKKNDDKDNDLEVGGEEDDFEDADPDFVGQEIVVPAGVSVAASAPPTVYERQEPPVQYATSTTRTRPVATVRSYDKEEGEAFASARQSRVPVYRK